MKKWKKVLLHVLIVLLVMAGVCGYFLFQIGRAHV